MFVHMFEYGKGDAPRRAGAGQSAGVVPERFIPCGARSAGGLAEVPSGFEGVGGFIGRSSRLRAMAAFGTVRRRTGGQL
ncbi:hypothetical protein GCM10010297_36130 [Streptomyces malachitofuscus]|nr:hypothetical protein GCM10010297_36130 [Streptomyces malachitofuscus]